MAFTPKDWKDATGHDGGGDTSTPLTAAALEDLETRLAAYADTLVPVFSTYTPTLTNVTNIAASTPKVTQYFQIGNMVHVAGRVVIDATAAGAIDMGISLPVASNFALAEELGGTGATIGPSVPEVATISADATSDRARFQSTVVGVANNSWFFTFTYQVI